MTLQERHAQVVERERMYAQLKLLRAHVGKVHIQKCVLGVAGQCGLWAVVQANGVTVFGKNPKDALYNAVRSWL